MKDGEIISSLLRNRRRLIQEAIEKEIAKHPVIRVFDSELKQIDRMLRDLNSDHFDVNNGGE